MKRLNDHFIESLETRIGLETKTILEIGCGNGAKSAVLARSCSQLYAIDPDETAIGQAQQDYSAENLIYSVGKAEELDFEENTFDIVLFSLSLHHVPIDLMSKALNEAARVGKSHGSVVVLEPTFTGTFFDAELMFGASDGDERKEKAAAYYTLLNTAALKEVEEFYDEISFVFTSEEDFITAMTPHYNLKNLSNFLHDNDYQLTAQRRVNIYTPNV